MSRIGKKPIPIPRDVKVAIADGNIKIEGPKGTLLLNVHPDIAIKEENGEIIISVARDTKKTPALWGLTRALVFNMVEGVNKGFEKKLEFEGVGYRANLEGNDITFQLGFSHSVKFPAPQGISFKIEKNVITVSGINKQLVGEVSSRIRALKPPEPYKGKGIHYKGEIIRRKAGKKVATA